VTCHTYAQRQYGVHDARTGSYICETGLKIEGQDKDSDLGWSYLKELRDGVIDPLQILDVAAHRALMFQMQLSSMRCARIG
jgi:hypothetical protein